MSESAVTETETARSPIVDDLTVVTKTQAANEATVADSESVVASTAGAGADQAITASARIWSGMWLAGLTFSLMGQPDTFRSFGVAAAALVVLWIGWLAGLVLRMVPATWFVWVCIGTALVAELDTTTTAIPAAFPPFVTWLNLAVMMAGFLLPARVARRIVVVTAVVAGLLAVGLTGGAGMLAQSWRPACLTAVYALVVGMATVTALGALRKAASVDDREAASLAEATALTAKEQTINDESFRISRSVHDHVLNTFSAIRRGWAGDLGLLQRRCAADQRALRYLSTAVPAEHNGYPESVTLLIESARQRAAALGLHLEVISTGTGCRAPAAVSSAMREALDEALLNVSKHAKSDDVRLAVRAEPELLELVVSDPGVGTSTNLGTFAPASIGQRCLRSGVEAEVTSTPDFGTRVSMRWSAPLRNSQAGCGSEAAGSNADQANQLAARLLTPAVRQMLAWFVALFAFSTMLSIGVQPIAPSSIAVIGATSLALLLALRPIGRPLTPWLIAALVGATAILTSLPGTGAAGCERVGLLWWGADAGMLMVVVVMLLSRRLLPTGLAYLAYLAGIVSVSLQVDNSGTDCDVGTILVVVVLIELGAIIGIWLLQSRVVQLAASAVSARAAAADAAAQTASIRAQRGLRASWNRRGLGLAGDLLEGLASGYLNPLEVNVKSECARQEVQLRSLVNLGTEPGPLNDMLAGWITQAQQQAVVVETRVGLLVPNPSAPGLVELERLLDQVLADATPGSDVVITTRPEPNGGVLTIVTRSLDGSANLTQPETSELFFEVADLGDQLFVEVRWPTARATHEGQPVAVSHSNSIRT